MINDNELRISNMSYTNKDFASIYKELLDIISKISPKWNPINSNESDPGIVLTKLAAFIGDKNNYNIDKNVLESFMPSATQESSMRTLCEIQGGYNMKYYTSATTNVLFTYTGNKTLGKVDGVIKSIELPAFTTVVSDTEGSVSFILKEPVKITANNRAVSVPAIEGTLKTLKPIGNKNVIMLSDLTDRKIYISDKEVASNGIFIFDIDSNGEQQSSPTWKLTNNLSLEKLGEKVFKFSFDSQVGLPYIEFPSDISNLIGAGLVIQYVITKGVDGNISANTLSTLSSPTSINVGGEDYNVSDIIITNPSGTSNGNNPESIDDAYNGFKKTVGTFDTLVSCKNYADAIYNLLSTLSDTDITSTNNVYSTDAYTPVVSNVQVADRRTDINYSKNVVTYDTYGSHNISLTRLDEITPFDLCIYPLEPITTQYDENTFKSSFTKCTDIEAVKSGIEEYKTISHNYKELKESDIYLIKNYYKLDVRISTYNKVDKIAQEALIKNVKLALYKAFNARNVDYGYEIPYDSLYKVIKNADSNIKEVSLDEPELSTSYLLNSGDDVREGDTNYNDIYENIVAKNVLEGRISLFDYEDNFQFEYGQTLAQGSTGTNIGPVIESLKSIGTEVTIKANDLKSGSDENPIGYTLKENEVIQFISPNFRTDIQYVYGVWYRWTGNTVAKNEEHQIVADEKLTVYYQDSSTKQYVTKEYTATDGKIVKPNFDMLNTDSASGTSTPTGKTEKFSYLSQSQTLDIRKTVKIILDNANNTITPIYWIRNNPDDKLFLDSEYDDTNKIAKTILSDGEYFIYTNSSKTELNILGSGTRLVLSNLTSVDDLASWKISSDNQVTAEAIDEKGLAAFNEFNWQIKNLSATPLTLSEMQIYTLDKGTAVYINSLNKDIKNKFIEITNGVIKYKGVTDSEWQELPTIAVSNVKWEVRSRLDINAGPNLSQSIVENQKVTFVDKNNNPVTLTQNTGKDTQFRLSVLVQRAGNDEIELPYVYIKETSGNVKEYRVNAMAFNYVPVTLNNVVLPLNRDNMYILNMKDLSKVAGGLKLPYVYYQTNDLSGELIMLYWVGFGSDTVSVTGQPNSLSVYPSTTLATTINLVKGINIIKINNSNTANELTIKVTGTDADLEKDTLILSKIKVAKNINGNFGLTEVEQQELLNKIKAMSTVDGVNYFNYITDIDNQEAIDIDNLRTPESFLDKNNVANAFTLPEIDFDNSKFAIVKSSRL